MTFHRRRRRRRRRCFLSSLIYIARATRRNAEIVCAILNEMVLLLKKQFYLAMKPLNTIIKRKSCITALLLSVFNTVVALTAVNGLEDNDYNDAYDYYEDDDDDNEDKCPTIDLPAALDGRCHISDSCSKITCEASVQNKHATIIFRVNRCDDPLSATVTIKSRGFSVDWSHTFKDDDEVKLPVDTGRMNAIGKVSVSLKVMLKKKEKKLHFKVFIPRLFASP